VASLDGYESGDVYVNDFFGFRFKFPAGWQRVPAQTKAAVLKSLNVAAPYADTRILVMLLQPNDGELPDTIAVFSARSSIAATDGAKGGVAYFQQSRKGESDTHIIAPIRIVQFSGRSFAREDVQASGQAHFMADFASVRAGYLLSFQAHAATRDRLEAVVKVLSASVQFK